MSSTCLVHEQSQDHNDKHFIQLMQLLTFFQQELQTNQSFEPYYKTIGVKQKQLLQTFHIIVQYFKSVYQMQKNQQISPSICDQLYQGVTDYLLSENYKSHTSCQKAVFLLQAEIKIGSCMQAFNTLLNENHNHQCIAYSQKQQYQHVWDSIEIVEQQNKQKIKENYSFLKKILILTTTAVMIQRQAEWMPMKKILFGLSYPRYFLDYSTARLRTFSFFRSPTIKMTKEIWNIPENGWSKGFIKLTFQNISFHQKIYIPFEDLKDDQFPDIYTPNRNAIKVRVLYWRQLKMKNRSSKGCCDWELFKSKKRNETKIDTIMIHMHGGGFIALSSRMMQSTTRKWANELKIPIFSIDYRKPPEHPFPAAPNDCLTVYKFILKKISYYMDIDPKNIYLAGDSAGGNLACSLMANILINKLQIPKGIYLAYPTIDIRRKFSPSKVNSLMDPLLWPTMLEMILKQYLGKDHLLLQQNPLASPLLLTQAFIGGNTSDKRFPLQWPKTFISVGQKDTFYDDSLILMQKLKESNIQCYCRVYKQFCHGYLSTMIMMKECYFALGDSVNDLKRLIKENNGGNS